jgi:hydrogenase maturation protein HypF
LPDRTSKSVPPAASPDRARRRWLIHGRVQGVGFRPFVYRLATEMKLGGHVGNDSRGAFIEAEGSADDLQRFGERLRAELPPLAQIASVQETDLTVAGEKEFRIRPSVAGGDQKAEITPDAATCEDCLRELNDPADRRSGYPFINCTHCGPRYSIVRDVPYDRVNTTMSTFTMCPACQAEYDDPADRRFHAQPNACSVCGPRVWLADRDGNELPGEAIPEAAKRLAAGDILAVKGLGGFHLACRADDDHAVAELRRRKNRESKPLAVMVASLQQAEQLATLDPTAAEVLTCPVRPIVLAPKRPEAPVSEHVAPISECLGILLPYTPLHELLFAQGLGPLVMTSGNPSAEPLCCDNDEARQRLGEIADAFLLHDRDIERRVDDSVVLALSLPDARKTSRIMPVRRARGLVPAPIHVRAAAAKPILAVGGELKSTVCLLHGHDAVLSEHLGDLTNPAAFRNFTETVECFQTLLDVRPEAVACDLHPDYAATRYASSLGLPVTQVQHHHAHVVSCMAENDVAGEVIGVACDGTGYGTDGTVWGCEVLVCDEADFRRPGHLRTFALPGGDAASIETWRPAAGVLTETYGADWPDIALQRVDPDTIALTRRRLAADAARIPRTSSLGRLFDAAASLLDICDRNRCEAEAPMALEAAAARYEQAEPFEWALDEAEDGTVEMDFRLLVRDLVGAVEAGRPAEESARRFHETVAAMLAGCVERIAKRTGLDRVMLTGGCFANRLLLRRLWDLLRASGLDVYIHGLVPPGDGGVALGQAVAAAARLEKGTL